MQNLHFYTFVLIIMALLDKPEMFTLFSDSESNIYMYKFKYKLINMQLYIPCRNFPSRVHLVK